METAQNEDKIKPLINQLEKEKSIDDKQLLNREKIINGKEKMHLRKQKFNLRQFYGRNADAEYRFDSRIKKAEEKTNSQIHI